MDAQEMRRRTDAVIEQHQLYAHLCNQLIESAADDDAMSDHDTDMANQAAVWFFSDAVAALLPIGLRSNDTEEIIDRGHPQHSLSYVLRKLYYASAGKPFNWAARRAAWPERHFVTYERPTNFTYHELDPPTKHLSLIHI